MITFTVADLIHEPAVSVLQDNSLWSVFMAQVVDVAEWELKERPESARLVRPISFCLAQEFGPAHYSVGRIASTAKFVNEKRVYDLLRIPAHRDHPFRLNVTACSGRS